MPPTPEQWAFWCRLLFDTIDRHVPIKHIPDELDEARRALEAFEQGQPSQPATVVTEHNLSPDDLTREARAAWERWIREVIRED